MATAVLVSSSAASTGPADVIAWQRQRIASGQFQVLGKIWIISLEAAKDAHTPHAAVANSLGSRLEFYSDGGREIGPRLAFTGASGSLLVLDPIIRSDGVVGLPDIPDPAWRPPVPTDAQLQGAYTAPKARMIPQHLVDRGDGFGGRARGKITAADTSYLVCGPVAQIVVRPLDGENRILPTGLILRCLPSIDMPGTKSTLMEMLIDAASGQVFLYGGRFEIGCPG